MPPLAEVPVSPVRPERFATVLDGRYDEMAPEIARARERLRGRAVWHVNSTARGGGVAEMLRSHLAYVRGAGVDVRWMVVGGNEQFFEVTKRIHNLLHESPGDGRPLDEEARAAYEGNLAAGAAELAALVRPGDAVFLHDPQTAGLVDSLRDAGAAVVWRCHVGVDRPGDLARRAWEFLHPY